MNKPSEISMLVVTIMADKDHNYRVKTREERYSVSGNSSTSHTLKRIVDGGLSLRHERIQASQLMEIDKAGFIMRSDAAYYRIYFDSTKTEEAIAKVRKYITEDLQMRVADATAMNTAWLTRHTQTT
jgi:hypothetical protein